MSDTLKTIDYRRRVVDDEIDALVVGGVAAIAIEGAKAVGKSATAAQRATTTFLLEQPTTRELVLADPSSILVKTPVLIDEWQHLPATWDAVRRAVDAGAGPGQFFLTGSASAANPGTHSGAGRIVKVRMRPMSLFERGVAVPSVSLVELLSGKMPTISGTTSVNLALYVNEIVCSGFPALRILSGRALRAQLHGYIDRVIDRDFPEIGRAVRNPAALRRWFTAYAAATSTSASYDTIRNAASPGEGQKLTKLTTQPYRDTLERLYLLDPLPAWLPTHNHFRELASSPKHHLVDPALAVSLLDLSHEKLITGVKESVHIPRDGSILGALFESLVVQSLRTYAQLAEATVGHFRTHRGDHEVDVIIERADGKIVAFEIKLSATVEDSDVRHLLWLKEKLGADLLDAVIVTTGPHAYRRSDGIAVVPASLIGP